MKQKLFGAVVGLFFLALAVLSALIGLFGSMGEWTKILFISLTSLQGSVPWLIGLLVTSFVFVYFARAVTK